MPVSGPPVILLYGNCQADYLRRIMSSLPCLHGKVEFKVFALHLMASGTWDDFGPDLMRRVICYWEQVHLWGDAAGQAELRKRLPPNCKTIRFPMMSINAFWPFITGRMRPVEGRAGPVGHYDDGDLIALQLRTAQLDDDALYEAYLTRSDAAMPNLIEMFERFDVPRMASLDQKCDIGHKDFILRNLRGTQLFTSVPHLSPKALRYLAERLGAATPCSEHCSYDQLVANLDWVLDHHAGFDVAELPLHPAVAEQFKLAFVKPGQRYKWHQYRWTHRQYILSLIRDAPFAR